MNHHLISNFRTPKLIEKNYQYMDVVGKFRERLILMNDDVVIGLFAAGSIPVLVMISSSGEYVWVSTSDSFLMHLTKFVPSQYFDPVKRCVQFRNKFAANIFACDRFNATDSECLLGTAQTQWRRNPPAVASLGKWKGFGNIKENSSISICPFRKRLMFRTFVAFRPETKHILSSSNLSSRGAVRIVSHQSLYPIAHTPWAVSDLLAHLATDSDGELSSEFAVSFPSCTTKAKEVHIAQQVFAELGPELANLMKPDCYPATSRFAVMVECVDGEVCAWNPASFVAPTRDIFVDAHGSTYGPRGDEQPDIAMEVEVEAWIDEVVGPEGLKSRSAPETDTEDKGGIVARDEKLSTGLRTDVTCPALLSLAGHIFTLFTCSRQPCEPSMEQKEQKGCAEGATGYQGVNPFSPSLSHSPSHFMDVDGVQTLRAHECLLRCEVVGDDEQDQGQGQGQEDGSGGVHSAAAMLNKYR